MTETIKERAIKDFATIVAKAESGSEAAQLQRLYCLASGYGVDEDFCGAVEGLGRLAANGNEGAVNALEACRLLLPKQNGRRRARSIAGALESVRDAHAVVAELDAEPLISDRFHCSDDPAEQLAIDDALLERALQRDIGNTRILLCGDPQVVYLPKLIPDALCDYIASIGQDKKGPAFVYNDEVGNKLDVNHRDANVYMLSISNHDIAVQVIMRKIVAQLGYEFERLESAQIVDYAPSQKFGYHHDYFTVKYLESGSAVVQGGQRIVSIIAYLNDDYIGGETSFPELGFKVKGSKGGVLMFKDTILDRVIDMRTRHAGLPVESGTKRVLVNWIRQHRWR